MNDMVMMDLLERAKHRFFGKYRGVVDEVDAKTMRIKARVPAVLGTITSGWCEPCVPYAGPGVGFCMLPDKDSGVWIEFEGGDVSNPIWVGGYWRESEIPDGVSKDVKAIVADAGTIKLDNKAKSVSLDDGNGATLTLSDGSSTLDSRKGKLVADSSGVSVNDGSLTVS